MMKHLAALSLALAVCAGAAIGQSYDLQFAEVQNTGSVYDVQLQIRAGAAPFDMGGANLVFTYNTAMLSAPLLQTAHGFSGGTYAAMTVTQPGAGRVSVNIELLATGSGSTVPASFTPVATIRFAQADPAGNPLLRWRTSGSSQTVVFLDDDSTLAARGTLSNLDEPLSVQLVAFGAAFLPGTGVQVTWTTQSETNNFGFEVQRGSGQPTVFSTIPGSFRAGQGTSVQPHEYSFTDTDPEPGIQLYRLRQIDLAGTDHFTEAVPVEVLTGVTEELLPAELALDQNYPNPFNPSTLIRFALPSAAQVRLELYTITGERVAVLADGAHPAGFHAVRVDGTGLATGMYLYRLTAGEKVFQRKMLLVK